MNIKKSCFHQTNVFFFFFLQWPILNYYIHAVLNSWLCKMNTESESMLVSYTFWCVLNDIITEKIILTLIFQIFHNMFCADAVTVKKIWTSEGRRLVQNFTSLINHRDLVWANINTGLLYNDNVSMFSTVFSIWNERCVLPYMMKPLHWWVWIYDCHVSVN